MKVERKFVMEIELTGDALKLFEAFLHYSKTNPIEIADAMCYDYSGFGYRLKALAEAYNNAEENS